MTLHTFTRGNGPELFLVHGWGMNGGIWSGIMDRLGDDYRITAVDLPGHGASALHMPFSLATVRDALLDAAPPKATWIGWSLGGMLATAAAAQAPDRFEKLVLVASSPRFVRDDDWVHAMEPGVLAGFGDDLQQDFRATLNRFLALQVRGSDAAGATLRRLRAEITAHGEPDPDALAAGLQLLGDVDLRETLGHIATETLFITGERDTLMPVRAAGMACTRMASAQATMIVGAGHAPFVSHPDQFADTVRTFVAGIGTALEAVGHE